MTWDACWVWVWAHAHVHTCVPLIIIIVIVIVIITTLCHSIAAINACLYACACVQVRLVASLCSSSAIYTDYLLFISMVFHILPHNAAAHASCKWHTHPCLVPLQPGTQRLPSPPTANSCCCIHTCTHASCRRNLLPTACHQQLLRVDGVDVIDLGHAAALIEAAKGPFVKLELEWSKVSPWA